MKPAVVGKVSGGMGSYLAVRRHVKQHGRKWLRLCFTDTFFEDQDAYRFLIASAAVLYGVELPAHFIPEIEDFPAWEDRQAYHAFVAQLAHDTMKLMPDFAWTGDGRDPIEVYETRNFLGNHRRDPCSEILKRKFSRKWLEENCDPAKTLIIFGLDYEEEHRWFGGPKGAGLRSRLQKDGWIGCAPLCMKPYEGQLQWDRYIQEDGLWIPRLNQLGFAHNNCGGFCCKAGIGHWLLLRKVMPERFAYSARAEQKLLDRLGPHTMLSDRRGVKKGERRKSLSLNQLAAREDANDVDDYERSEMGGCACFSGDPI